MTLPTTTTLNGCDDDSDMFGPPRSSPPIGYRSRVPMISPKLRQREERKRILQLCAHKLERIKDSETNLRRSVCINNTYCRLTDELRREKQSRYLANLPKSEVTPESARDNIFNPYNSCGIDSSNHQPSNKLCNSNNSNSTNDENVCNNQNTTLTAGGTTITTTNLEHEDLIDVVDDIDDVFHMQNTAASNNNQHNHNNNNNNNNNNNLTDTTTTTTITVNDNNNNKIINNNNNHNHNNNTCHGSSCTTTTTTTTTNTNTICCKSTSNSTTTSATTTAQTTIVSTTITATGTIISTTTHQQQQQQQRRKRQHKISNNTLDTDLEILDRELNAINSPLLIDPEITQGAEQLEKALLSSTRKRARAEDESDRLVREALSQFYIPPQRFISAIEDCPLDLVSATNGSMRHEWHMASLGVGLLPNKRSKLDYDMHHHHHLQQQQQQQQQMICNNNNINSNHNNNIGNNVGITDLELDFDMNPNQKDFEVIMDALRLGTPSPTPTNDSCGQAAMMLSESASVFHNLVVTSLET